MSLQPRFGRNGHDRKASSPRSARRRSSRVRSRSFLPRYELMEDRTLLSTMLWTNAAGGDWDVATNWVNQADSSDQHVPTASDDAQISTSGITVTHASSTSDSVNSLTVSSSQTTLSLSNGTLLIAAPSTISGDMVMRGGTLTGAGTLTVDGSTTWSGGTMSGTGVTNAQGGLALGGTGTNYSMSLDQRTFNNAGDAQFYAAVVNGNSSVLQLSSGALFDNLASGSFTFADDLTSILNNGGTPTGGTFQNDGALIKQGGGTSIIGSGITFNDLGASTLTVSAGTLSLQNGGTIPSTSTVQVSSGGTLDFGAGTFYVASGITGSGGSTVSFSGGTTNITGVYNIAGLTRVTNGTLNSSSATALSTGSLTQSGGTLTGSDVVNVSGLTTWTGGTMSGTGVTNAQGGLVLGVTGVNSDYSMSLDQRTFNNAGDAQFYAGINGHISVLQLSSGALFDNLAGGSFTFADDPTSILNNGGTPTGGTFQNDGGLIKQGGGTSVIGSGITFNDLGASTLTVSAGTLSLQNGGTIPSTSMVQISSGGTLDFGAGTFYVASGITGSGGSTVSFSGGTTNITGVYNIAGLTRVTNGTLNSSSATALSTGSLTQSGGTLTGSDVVNVSGLTTWTGGTMSGTGVTNAQGGLVLGVTGVNSDYSMSLDQRTFNNAGDAQFYAGINGHISVLQLSSGALFDNLAGGSFTFADDPTSILNNGGTP